MIKATGMSGERNLIIATLKGVQTDEEFIILQEQLKGGLIKIFMLRYCNGGISPTITNIGKTISKNYHCDDCVCELSIDQLEEIVKHYCENTVNMCSEEEREKGLYYSFISLKECSSFDWTLKKKYAKQVADLVLLKFPKKNGTMNIEAAAKALNTSKHNLYKVMQIGKYKGANYNIDLLQSILDDLRSF